MNKIHVEITVTMPNGDLLKLHRRLDMPETGAGDAVAQLVANLAEEISEQRIFAAHRVNAEGLTDEDLDHLEAVDGEPVRVSFAPNRTLEVYAALAERGLVAPRMTLTSSHYELTEIGMAALQRAGRGATRG